MPIDNTITQEELKKTLHYNPETGLFTRLAATANNQFKAGQVAGCVNGQGYVQIMINRRLYRAHRLAWFYVNGSFPPDQIDHINGVRDDNRISNLRPATTSQNNRNARMHSDNTSGFKGVTWHRRCQKWQVQCQANGKEHYLGHFDTPEAASSAYQTFAAKHHGQFYNDGVAVC